MPEKACPKCSKPMQHPALRMSKIDTCQSCGLVYLDSVELGFLAGRDNLESNLAKHAKPVQHCARCNASFEGDTHCGEQQRFTCLGCNAPMHEVRLYIPISNEPQQELDPYRGSILENSQQNKTTARLYRCPSCQGILLSEHLFELFTKAFTTKPSRGEKTEVDYFRDALLAIFIEDEKRKNSQA